MCTGIHKRKNPQDLHTCEKVFTQNEIEKAIKRLPKKKKTRI
jgi:hypothetical protein